MKKNTPTTKTCKLCLAPVNDNTGIQCKGACKKWIHFECLKFTPGKIQDIKNGIIQVNCPCPTCKTSTPKEVVVDCPTMRGDKCSSPPNKAPVCEEPLCPSHFKKQDIKCIPKQLPDTNSYTKSPVDLPPESPASIAVRKPGPVNLFPKQDPEQKTKPKAKPLPGTEFIKEKLQLPKMMEKTKGDKSAHPFAKPSNLEKTKACSSQKIIHFPEQNALCECPDSSVESVKDDCFPQMKIPPCEAPPEERKKILPEEYPSKAMCLCPPANEEPDWEYATPPALPKTSSSYPDCCPQGPNGQRNIPCGYIEKTASEHRIPTQEFHNEALITTLQNLCTTMGELTKQVQNLMGNFEKN